MNDEACAVALEMLNGPDMTESKWAATHSGLTALLLSVQLVKEEDFEEERTAA